MGAAKMIAKWQISAIYKLGSDLGIYEKGNLDDNLHGLVNALTGSKHISKLTEDQGRTVFNELQRMAHSAGIVTKRKKKRQDSPGGMTAGQQDKVWRLMYRLRDASPSEAQLGSRVCGVINASLGIDASPKEPFRWLNYQQGSQLIEILKRYVASAEHSGKGGGADVGGAGTAGAASAGRPGG